MMITGLHIALFSIADYKIQYIYTIITMYHRQDRKKKMIKELQ